MGPKQKGNKSSQSDDFDLSSFSPVVKESPSQPTQGNLTGSARKLKDGAANLHNYMQKWSLLNTDGASIVNEIANLKLEKILHRDDEASESDTLPDALIPLCEKLETTINKMENVVSRLCGLVDMSKAIKELENHRQSDIDTGILFQTWHLEKFSETFSEIYKMYQKELSVKQCILENICHCRDRKTIMFYTAAWLHQAYIDTNSEFLLQAMLLETRHKT